MFQYVFRLDILIIIFYYLFITYMKFTSQFFIMYVTSVLAKLKKNSYEVNTCK